MGFFFFLGFLKESKEFDGKVVESSVNYTGNLKPEESADSKGLLFMKDTVRSLTFTCHVRHPGWLKDCMLHDLIPFHRQPFSRDHIMQET